MMIMVMMMMMMMMMMSVAATCVVWPAELARIPAAIVRFKKGRGGRERGGGWGAVGWGAHYLGDCFRSPSKNQDGIFS